MFNAEVEFGADMTVLPAPVIALDGAVVGWNAVDGADEYKVYVNGEYTTTVEQTTYTIEATAEGLYTVTVIATGEGALDSVQSNEVRYMHSTLDLAKPVYATYTIGENGIRRNRRRQRFCNAYFCGGNNRLYAVYVVLGKERRLLYDQVC